MTFQPISHTIPNRKPFVRCPTFIDGKGPPTHDFFDETQDHLGAYYHALLGTEWSCQTEDFDNEAYPPGFLGQFTLKTSVGLTLNPLAIMQQGDAGVWIGQSGTTPFIHEMGTNLCNIGTEDFLFTAKVRCLGVSHLDSFDRFGFHISMGGFPNPSLPGFAGGSGSPNWHIFCPKSVGVSPVYIDTGVPFLDSTWYILQWGRFRGGMRFFINGRLLWIDGYPGIDLPVPFNGCFRNFQTRRSAPGPLGDNFFIDYFHCFIKRANLSP